MTSTFKFPNDEGFGAEVRRRVLQHLAERRLSHRDSPWMYVKSAVLLAWFGLSYAFLAYVADTWWQAVPLSLSLALAMAGIGFGIQHDANHNAYSGRPVINRLMGATLDMLGASSYLWRVKHNVAHHTYTNVESGDDDIDLGPLARLSPGQKRLGIHRIQQFYMWLLYGLLLPKWHFIYDFKNVAQGQIARSPFARPKGWDLVSLIGGKLVFFGWAFVVPMFFHPWWVVLLFYAGTSYVLGLVLSVTFQLAHCMEEADFPAPATGSDRLPDAWARHQVQTTVDFARDNRLLTWYLGGLNFQIEHHLFPRVSHIHYPAIARIVEATCAEFGVRYTAHRTLRAAIRSHWRWLREMGRPTGTTSAQERTVHRAADRREPSTDRSRRPAERGPACSRLDEV